jgi:replicative DNA helicase
LSNFGEAEACDGLSYLISLDDGIPSLAHLDSWIRIICEKAVLRRTIFAAQSLINRCMSGTDGATTILADAASDMAKLGNGFGSDGETVTTATLLASQGVESVLGPRTACGSVSMPWSGVSAATMGLHRQQLIVMMAPPSRGKTSFGLQIAGHAAASGRRVAIWTMEMSPLSIFRRMVSQLSACPVGKRADSLSAIQREGQSLALESLEGNPVAIDSKSRSVARFAQFCRRYRADLAIVDYLQLIRGTARQSNRAVEVSENSRGLKLMSMDLDIPVLALSQVDRSSVKGDNARIGLHSAKESGDIENDADVMMWVNAQPFSRAEQTPAELFLGKQREGPAGFAFPMMFEPTTQRFMEIE